MDGFVRTRRLIRRSKKVWVAGLCAASFACGQALFGDDTPAESDSLLSQYLKTTKQVVAEVPAPTAPSARRQPNSPGSPAPNVPQPPLRAEPAIDTSRVKQTDTSPIANDSPELQQKRQTSSRRVKPPSGSPPTATTAKTETATTPKIEETNTAVVATQPENPVQVVATPLETKPQPSVKFVEVPRQSAPPQKLAEPQIQVVTSPAIQNDSPRIGYPAAENKPAPATQPQIIENNPFFTSRSPALRADSIPATQPLNVTRSATPPLPYTPQPNSLRTVSAVGDENLPPIVSPDSVPRPGMRKKMQQAATATIQPTAPTPVLRIELGTKQPPAP